MDIYAMFYCVLYLSIPTEVIFKNPSAALFMRPESVELHVEKS